MGLVDNTYFVNDISVAGQILETNNNFDDVINRYEPEILKALLGYELWKALEADLIGGEPQTDRFKDLVSGAEFSFEVCGETINEKWDGLRGLNFESLIAYYVYYQYRSQQDAFYSGARQQNEALTENSTKGDVYTKLVDVWNNMLCMYGDVKVYCYRNANYTYSNYGYRPNWRDLSTYEHYNDAPSAYNFLLANVDDYPEWVFRPLKKQNQFDI